MGGPGAPPGFFIQLIVPESVEELKACRTAH